MKQATKKIPAARLLTVLDLSEGRRVEVWKNEDRQVEYRPTLYSVALPGYYRSADDAEAAIAAVVESAMRRAA